MGCFLLLFDGVGIRARTGRLSPTLIESLRVSPQRRKKLTREVFAICALIFGGGSAVAADLPNIKEPSVAPALPVPAFSWTGFYVGVNGGYGLDHVSFPYAVVLPPTYSGQSALTERGPAFGGQVGYNYEIIGVPLFSHVVVGVEGDADWGDINGSATIPTSFGPATLGTRIENFGTLRGRIGYSFDRLLIYIGGGLSYATTENYYSGPGYVGSATTTRLPLQFSAYSIGAEYAVANNWSVRAEYTYDYIRAGWNNYCPAPGISVGFMSRATFHVARVGLNYHFDIFAPPAPVVARY
jgi:outer membrane immunogenic protein